MYTHDAFLCKPLISAKTSYVMDPESNNWKFAQCFGDKGEAEEVTEGLIEA